MLGLRKIPILIWFFVLIGIHVDANPVSNNAEIEKKSSWLMQWQNCFFNDESQDVGHFFLTRLINCWPTSITAITSPTKKFLIVGGFGFHRETDVIDLNTNSDMMKSTFGKIPSRRIYAVGGLLGSNPIICGGYSFGSYEDYHNDCITLKDSKWIQTHETTIKRSYSASVQLNKTTLWILGGTGWQNPQDYGALDSTEFIGIDSNVGHPGPNLPYLLSKPCAVKYSEDKIYVIGGSRYNNAGNIVDGFSNKNLIFNPMNGFTHIEGPSMISDRRMHSCGLMTNGNQSKIVVAGGENIQDPKGVLSSVEIFDPTTNKWSPGPSLPYRLSRSAMVTSPDGGGVLLFGGYNYDYYDDENYPYNVDNMDNILELRYGSDKWTILSQRMKPRRQSHVVIPFFN